MNQALLLIDLQNDYFPGGACELEGSDAALANAAQLLAAARQNGTPVIHIRHISLRPGAGFFLPGTRGVDIHQGVAPAAGEAVIDKHFPNSFRDTPLRETLAALGVSRLLVAGMMTHMCVDATVRAAFDFGLECRVAADACATRALAYQDETIAAQQVHAAFLAALNGVYAEVLATSAILSQRWLKQTSSSSST